MLFSSCDTMSMLTTSRRDDLISLCYIMIYLLEGRLPFYHGTNQESVQKDQDKEFYNIRAKKKSLRPIDLCQSHSSAKILKFMNDVFDLKFDERPYYDKLRF